MLTDFCTIKEDMMSFNMFITEAGPDPYAEVKRKWRDDNKDKHRATRNQAKNNARKIRGFIGVDGEGQRTHCETAGCACRQYSPLSKDDKRCGSCPAGHGEDAHYHAYVLLGVGNQYISTEILGIPEIGWEESFEFLYKEFRKPANRYKVFCGFFLGYDFTEIFKSLPRDIAWKLYNSRGNIRSEDDRDGPEDKRPVSDRKPVISSRELVKGKPWPVRIAGKRGSWEFDTLDERQVRLRPMTCGCAELSYHSAHCHCGTADHHLKGKLCLWQDGDCKCDDKIWHSEHCHSTTDGEHPGKPHHSSTGCTRVSGATVPVPEWMYVNDTGSFFQKSFLKVIDPVDWSVKNCEDCRVQPCLRHEIAECPDCKPPACDDHSIVTREEFLAIERGKERRDSAVLDAEMIAYNKRENLLLARVMEKFREGLDHFGISLRVDQWYGPGQAAGKWIDIQGQHAKCARKSAQGRVLRADNPLARKDTPAATLDILVEKAARASYIAGWFEIMAHGHVPGTTWEYDINSAYPAVIKDLPCMAHGKWEIGCKGGSRLSPLPKGAAFRLVHATVSGSDPHIGAMLHRDAMYNNSICRPHNTHSWFWQDELEASRDAGLIDTIAIGCGEDECKEGSKYGSALTLTYFPKPSCGKLCAAMEDMYQERLRVGKNSPMGKAAKLVYNSVYGKFAQLVGSPAWASNIYASRITSGCRKMILNAIATHPERSKAVVMIATDGIYFTSEHPTLPVSKDKLGLWEESKHENLTLFKPGVYWDDDTREKITKGEAPQFKSRGVSARKFATQIEKIDAMFSTWNGEFPADEKSWPTVTFNAGFSQVSCKQALIRGKWDTAGDVSTTGKLTQNSFPDSKREWALVESDCTLEDAAFRIVGEYDQEYKIYRSKPVIMNDIVSAPRKENQATEYLKDNGELFDSLTPDGPVNSLFASVLGVRD